MRRLIFSLIALTLILSPISVNASAEDSDVRFELNVINSWGELDNSYVQLDGTVYNNLSWSVHGWTAKLKADSGVYVENSWNCFVSVDNGIITITPDDYINTVPTGASVVFGLILRNAGAVETAGFNVSLPDGSGYVPPEYENPTTDISEVIENQQEIISLLNGLNAVLSNFFFLFLLYIAFKVVMYIFVRVFFGGV